VTTIAPSRDFVHTSAAQPHPERARGILEQHPEVRSLYGRNPWTAVVVVALVAFQVASAWLLSHTGWVWVVVAAYVVGAFVSHGLFVLIHDCAHNLALRWKSGNLALAIVGDLALGFPSAITFRHYHLLHHANQGDYDLDADIAGRTEARLVGNVVWRKFLWLGGLGFMQGLRPLRVTVAKTRDAWVVANFTVIAAVDVAIVLLWGPKALVYLVLATVFALGLHPVGGRWIQEHVVTAPDQETYSYYGPLNRVAFNVGYHNEHHDFPGIPWHRLPALRALARETYDPLVSYRSWTGLVVRFLRDPSLGPWSRMVRP